MLIEKALGETWGRKPWGEWWVTNIPQFVAVELFVSVGLFVSLKGLEILQATWQFELLEHNCCVVIGCFIWVSTYDPSRDKNASKKSGAMGNETKLSDKIAVLFSGLWGPPFILWGSLSTCPPPLQSSEVLSIGTIIVGALAIPPVA